MKNTSTHTTAPAHRPSLPPKTRSRALLLLAGSCIGTIAALGLTHLAIRDDPSSTAALLYVFTIPVGFIGGMLIGGIVARFPT